MTVRFPSFAFAAQPIDIFRGAQQTADLLANLQKMHGQAILQRYLSPLLQQQLEQEQLKTQAAQITAPFAGPEEQARLAQLQAAPALTKAQTAQARAQARAQAAKATADIYKDPAIARMYQLSRALHRGDISQRVLQMAGLGGTISPTTRRPAIMPSEVPPGTIPHQIPSVTVPNHQTATHNEIQNYLLTGSFMSPTTQAGIKAAATANAKEASKSYAGEAKLASDNADTALGTLNKLSQFETSYNKAYKKWQKESILTKYNPLSAFNMARAGNIVPVGGQTFEAIASQMDPDIANALLAQRQIGLDIVKTIHLGRMTQYEFNLIMRTIPNMGMNPVGVKASIERLKTAKQRDLEYNNFFK